MRPNPNLIPRFNLDYNFSDLRYSINSLFSDNYDPKILNSTFGERKFYFTNYGRSALYVILKSLKIPPKSRIGVPLYSCNVVFDAIIKAGFIPSFIDIDSNYTLDPEDLQGKIDDLEAVVVIHTFGRPADMDKIKKIAGDKPIIEDCAHSLLSEYKGKKTGTLGDISYFSLAKYISIGGGGMIIWNNTDLMESISKNIFALEAPSAFEEAKDTFISYARSFFYHKPWYGLFALPVGLSLEDKIDFMNKKSFKVTAINKSDLNLMLYKLLLFKNKVERQRKNSLLLMEELRGTSITLPYEKKDTFCNYYLFPVLFSNRSQRDKASRDLRKNGVDTAKLFSKMIEIAKLQYGYRGDCLYTEQVADRILTIPNHYTLNRRELSKIIYAIKRGF